jgi:PAS domain S-box-containing protein
MPSQPAAAALTRLLARADRVADLLPRLHDLLVEVSDGRTSVLLQPEPRSGALLATSGSHLDELPRDGWLATPGERRAVAQARETGLPVLLENLAETAPGLASRLGAADALIVPLGDIADPQGVALVGLAATAAPGPPWEGVLAVADALVLALERARLHRESDLQRATREVLDEFSRAATSAVTLPAALADVCRGTARLFSAEHATVWLLDRDARELVRASASDPGDAALVRALAGDSGAATAALRSDRSELVEHDEGGDRRYTLAVPLRGRRRALGALVIEGVHLAPGGTLDVVERAEEAGRQLSAALENLQLIEQVLLSHRELEDTFNSLEDLVLVCDTVEQVRQVNDALAARVGRPRREMPGTSASSWLGPDLCALVAEVAAGAAAIVREVEDARLGGTFQAAVSPVRGADGRPGGIVVVARDVTERVRLEHDREDLQRRLAQADKLAALGKFVAGIAHELNNPLQGVLGHVELLRAANAFPPSIQREMRHVHREAERAAKIVRNLLVFSGSRRLDRRRIAPATVIGRVAALRTRALRDRAITVARDVAAPLPFLHADPLMLQQALLNIVLNAEQAVEDGGRIAIRARLTEAGTVQIEVHDSGPGIPPEILPHVFEPFFTTKDVGAGTGLGLAIAYGIVLEHGGTLTAATHAEGGAVFTITLPAGDRPATGRRQRR